MPSTMRASFTVQRSLNGGDRVRRTLTLGDGEQVDDGALQHARLGDNLGRRRSTRPDPGESARIARTLAPSAPFAAL